VHGSCKPFSALQWLQSLLWFDELFVIFNKPFHKCSYSRYIYKMETSYHHRNKMINCSIQWWYPQSLIAIPRCQGSYLTLCYRKASSDHELKDKHTNSQHRDWYRIVTTITNTKNHHPIVHEYWQFLCFGSFSMQLYWCFTHLIYTIEKSVLECIPSIN